MADSLRPTVYLASDHAGYELKSQLASFIEAELGFSVIDCGAAAFDEADDYPDFIAVAAKAVAENPNERVGIVLGGSGQGEAIAANRFPGVRAVVYYGEAGSQTDASDEELSMIASTRIHNNANVLSLGARFLSIDEAKQAVKEWLETPFAGEERHQRRINKLDQITSS